MARGIHRLTALQVARAARTGQTLNDGLGLILQKGASWIHRFKYLRRPHYMGLGSLRLVDLPAAREAHLANRQLLRAGINPLTKRDSERAQATLTAARTKTFDHCVTAYLDAHQGSWRNPKHRAQWQATLATYASPVIGKLPVADIDTGLVMRILQSIWKTKPETASRLRGRIESVFSWAKVHGYRTGENPARWGGHLDQLLPSKSSIRTVKHHTALPYDQIPAFMADLRQQDGVGALALEFIILTGVRTGDVIGQGRDDAPPMRWEHVDMDNRLWTIPKTKNGQEHRVPLSAAALAVLEQMRPLHDASGIVFPGLKRGAPLSNGAMLRVLDRMGRDLTTHGFRATFKTWASERTNFAREVIEACLTHTISDELEKAYRRGDFLDKRTRLMAAWADFCQQAPAAAGTTVVALRQK